MMRLRGSIPEQLAKAISVPTLVLYIVALAAGILLLAATPLATELSANRTTQHFEFFFVFFNVPLSLDMLTTSYVALAIYWLCFVEAVFDKGGFLASVRGNKRKSVPNWLIVAPLISSSLLVLVVQISRLQELLGLPTGSPSPRPLQILFAELTTAPISEEIGFRITPIGFLVALRILVSRTKGKMIRIVPLSFLVPDQAKSEAGLESISRLGTRGIHWSEWIVVGSSAVIFGIAHLEGSGSMWGVGKITTAAISGFALGLVYLIYGAYAAVLLHWFFDYYLQIAVIGSQVAPSLSGLHLFFNSLDLVVAISTTIVGIMSLFILPLILDLGGIKDRSDSSL